MIPIMSNENVVTTQYFSVALNIRWTIIHRSTLILTISLLYLRISVYPKRQQINRENRNRDVKKIPFMNSVVSETIYMSSFIYIVK